MIRRACSRVLISSKSSEQSKEMVRVGIPMMPEDDYMYMDLSVVNWLNSAGIEIVPIPSNIGAAEAAAYFEYVHGLYFLPGWPNNPGFVHLINTFMKMAIEANIAGDYFPVLGVCLGFQMILQHMGRLGTLETMNSARLEKQTMLRLHPEHSESRILQNAETHQVDYMKNHFRPYLNHNFGISLRRFTSTPVLRETFRIISTSHDRKGIEYVSMVEGRTLPFYGSQFHPELDVPNMDWMARFFRDELAKSRHTGFLPRAALPLIEGKCIKESEYTVPCQKLLVAHTTS